MKESRQISPVPVRLQPDLKRWLQHKAIDNHRSLTGEVAFRLEQSRALDQSVSKEPRQ